jgi:2'-5' RNA ligase
MVTSNAHQIVIVALPSENDAVRKFSSEKEPHLTLLYLGDPGFDSSQLDLVAGYVEHAASELSPFYLTVESRDVLGDQKADVLFFSKTWSKNVDTFRSQLLKNDTISKAYLAADQFDEWNPHLTMGFPATPAKPDTREYPGFTYVEFDRIALWNGDYTGPTFKLKYPEYGMGIEVAQSDQGKAAMNEVISHFGIKGMRWGVRTSRGGTPASTHKPSTDAETVDASKAKVKAGGTKTLSTKELQELVTRMNLEQQFSKLQAPSGQKKAGKIITDILLNVGKQQATKVASDLASKQISALLKG